MNIASSGKHTLWRTCTPASDLIASRNNRDCSKLNFKVLRALFAEIRYMTLLRNLRTGKWCCWFFSQHVCHFHPGKQIRLSIKCNYDSVKSLSSMKKNIVKYNTMPFNKLSQCSETIQKRYWATIKPAKSPAMHILSNNTWARIRVTGQFL